MISTTGEATPRSPIALGHGRGSSTFLLDPDDPAPTAGDGLAGLDLLAAVERADLRGRGGAAFPLAIKLRTVAERPGPRVVVANGEEGEPASVKDRWLLRHRPRLVLDGLLRAAGIVDAERAVLYVSDPEAARVAEQSVDALGSTSVPVTVHRVAPSYVAGEETAVVRALDGGPALPVDKPPRPFEAGVGGRPTLVSNVETLARLSLLAQGAPGPAASLLMTVTGACARPGLYDAPFGATLGAVIDEVAGPADDARGYLLGGFFGGLLGPAARELPIDPDVLRARGTGLGSGAVVVLGADDCPVGAAADVMAYFARENADQCGACIRGTPAMAGVLADLAVGTATGEQVEKLERWSTSLRGRGACGLLDGATVLAGSLLTHFPDEVREHLAAPCACCAARPVDPRETRFAVPGDRIPSPTTLGGPS